MGVAKSGRWVFSPEAGVEGRTSGLTALTVGDGSFSGTSPSFLNLCLSPALTSTPVPLAKSSRMARPTSVGSEPRLPARGVQRGRRVTGRKTQHSARKPSGPATTSRHGRGCLSDGFTRLDARLVQKRRVSVLTDTRVWQTIPNVVKMQFKKS